MQHKHGVKGGHYGSIWDKKNDFSGLVNGIYLSKDTTGEQAMRFVEGLQKYYEEEFDSIPEKERTALQGLISVIKNTYGEAVVQAWEETIPNFELQQFKSANKKIYDEYEKSVKEIKELKNKYDNATDVNERRSLKKKLQDLQKEYEKTYGEIEKIADDKIKESLEKPFEGKELNDFLKFRDDEGISWENLGTTTTAVESILNNAKKQMEESGTVTQDTISQLTNLYDLLQKKGNANWLKQFLDMLEELGIVVPDEWKRKTQTAAVRNVQEKQDGEDESTIERLKKDVIETKREFDNNKTNLANVQAGKAELENEIKENSIKAITGNTAERATMGIMLDLYKNGYPDLENSAKTAAVDAENKYISSRNAITESVEKNLDAEFLTSPQYIAIKEKLENDIDSAGATTTTGMALEAMGKDSPEKIEKINKAVADYLNSIEQATDSFYKVRRRHKTIKH